MCSVKFLVVGVPASLWFPTFTTAITNRCLLLFSLDKVFHVAVKKLTDTKLIIYGHSCIFNTSSYGKQSSLGALHLFLRKCRISLHIYTL